MKNFKEIAEKCLKGELSGTFITIDGGHIESNRIKKAENECYTFDRWHYIYDPAGGCLTGKYTWNIINFIPDMKENDKRTIQITLCQAREWYNSGDNTLKTLALSSFSKQELDPYPRSWSAYLEFHPGLLLSLIAPEPMCSKLMAYSKLLLLREEWIHVWSQEQGLEKDWKHDHRIKYAIFTRQYSESDEITVTSFANLTYPLCFPTKELATDFMNTFKSLLEQARGLY